MQVRVPAGGAAARRRRRCDTRGRRRGRDGAAAAAPPAAVPAAAPACPCPRRKQCPSYTQPSENSPPKTGPLHLPILSLFIVKRGIPAGLRLELVVKVAPSSASGSRYLPRREGGWRGQGEECLDRWGALAATASGGGGGGEATQHHNTHSSPLRAAQPCAHLSSVRPVPSTACSCISPRRSCRAAQWRERRRSGPTDQPQCSRRWRRRWRWRRLPIRGRRRGHQITQHTQHTWQRFMMDPT